MAQTFGRLPLKNITLSADERLIEAAREKARSKRTTLNAEFREWLRHYAQGEDRAEQKLQAYRRLMGKLSEVSAGGKRFSRDELNER